MLKILKNIWQMKVKKIKIFFIKNLKFKLHFRFAHLFNI